VPLVLTVSVALCPPAIVRDTGWEAIVGGTQVTVTVAPRLLMPPQPLETTTQYELVVVGATVKLEPVPPPTGDAVFPGFPKYHRYDIGAVPLTLTFSVAL